MEGPYASANAAHNRQQVILTLVPTNTTCCASCALPVLACHHAAITTFVLLCVFMHAPGRLLYKLVQALKKLVLMFV